jgi:hypothetical protein
MDVARVLGTIETIMTRPPTGHRAFNDVSHDCHGFVTGRPSNQTVSGFDGVDMPQHAQSADTERPAPPLTGHATLSIGDDEWDLFVCGLTRVGRDTFVQLTLLGPRACTVTVRARALVQGTTVRRILDAVCEWLLSGDRRDHTYLELPEIADRSC